MGSSDFSGGGICGFAPTPASNGNRAVPPQPAAANATNDSVPTINSRDEMHIGRHTAIKMPQARDAVAFLHNTPCVSSTSAAARQHLLTVSEERMPGNFCPRRTVNGLRDLGTEPKAGG